MFLNFGVDFGRVRVSPDGRRRQQLQRGLVRFILFRVSCAAQYCLQFQNSFGYGHGQVPLAGLLRWLHGAQQSEFQFRDTSAVCCHGRHHGHVQPCAQRCRIDSDSFLMRDVDHVERDEQRNLPVDQLADEVQIPFEVARIDNADDEGRLGRVVAFSQQDFDRNFFVGRIGREAVRSGQIDEQNLCPIIVHDASLFFLDRHTGVVADLLAHAGERVKECRLAGVRVADDGDDFGRTLHHCLLSTSTESASCLRSDKRYPRTEISSGSPKGAKRMTSSGVPFVRPISINR